MSVIDTLITDRTFSDVSRTQSLAAHIKAGTATAEELSEYLASTKGAYNASDLNRVGAVCAYIYAMFQRYGYDAPGYTELRTDWEKEDIPTEAGLVEYLSTVEALQNVLPTPGDLPESMAGLNVDGANEIERILFETHKLLIQMVYSMHRCAEYLCYSGSQFAPTMDTDFGRTWEELDAMNTRWANWNAATWYLLLYGNMRAEA